MLFSSITFLYYFLPLVIIIYYISPYKIKNTVLLLFSIVFYGWGEIKYIGLILFSIAIHYILGLLIEKHSNKIKGKIWFAISLMASLLPLFYYKYYDFTITNINNLTGSTLTLKNLILPIGISFYTFQIMSYTIDLYKKEVKAQRNILDLATYILLFPQLIAGPIVRYSDIARSLKSRTHTYEKFRIGLRRFILGLSKKVIIANSMGEICSEFYLLENKSVMIYWIYAIAFTLQIYFDFSGYSDMAIGMAKMFGFEFLENFNYPYISRSITEFWRRWHISLGSWFRDYVYIPLKGNRVNKARWIFNILVVWMLTGLWHGAAWNFVLWGLLFAALLIAEKLFIKKILDKLPVFISNIYVMVFVIIGFVIFDAKSLDEMFKTIKGMFLLTPINLYDKTAIYFLRSNIVVIVIAIIGSTPILRNISNKLKENVLIIMEPLILISMLIIVTAYLVDGSFNPFLYFRF